MATFRHRRSRAARSAAAGLVAAWLSLILQPCALALDSKDDHDCPHCPPAELSQHVGHEPSGHAAMDEALCITSADDCSPVNDLNYDGRTYKLEVKDLPAELPPVVFPGQIKIASLPPSHCAGWPRTRSPPPGKPTPLNILYCVYLD